MVVYILRYDMSCMFFKVNENFFFIYKSIQLNKRWLKKNLKKKKIEKIVENLEKIFYVMILFVWVIFFYKLIIGNVIVISIGYFIQLFIV